jgi:rhamnulokinase
MIEEIQAYCRETGQEIPQSAGEIARTIFDSLALTYHDYMNELEQLTGKSAEVLHIVGGGANNSLLNQLTADLIKREVKAGPSESTAIGNLVVQLIACGKLAELSEARQLIAKSFDIVSYQPKHIEGLEHVLNRWRSLKG